MSSLFESMNVPYAEKDGILYPCFSLMEQNLTSVGRFGLMWLSYMKENDRDRYKSLYRFGRLQKMAEDVNEEAYRMMDMITAQYMIKHPPRDKSSTMEMWRIREQARLEAEEVILSDLVLRPH